MFFYSILTIRPHGNAKQRKAVGVIFITQWLDENAEHLEDLCNMTTGRKCEAKQSIWSDSYNTRTGRECKQVARWLDENVEDSLTQKLDENAKRSRAFGATYVMWWLGENAKRSGAFGANAYKNSIKWCKFRKIRWNSSRVKTGMWREVENLEDSCNTKTGWECEAKRSIWSNLCNVMTGRECGAKRSIWSQCI